MCACVRRVTLDVDRHLLISGYSRVIFLPWRCVCIYSTKNRNIVLLPITAGTLKSICSPVSLSLFWGKFVFSLLCMHVRLFMQTGVFYSAEVLKFSLSMSVICREWDLCVSGETVCACTI